MKYPVFRSTEDCRPLPVVNVQDPHLKTLYTHFSMNHSEIDFVLKISSSSRYSTCELREVETERSWSVCRFSMKGPLNSMSVASMALRNGTYVAQR